jgi:hypothetical protein
MVSRSGQKEGGEGARLQLGGVAAFSGWVAYLMVRLSRSGLQAAIRRESRTRLVLLTVAASIRRS